jgi:hypothetical protein
MKNTTIFLVNQKHNALASNNRFPYNKQRGLNEEPYSQVVKTFIVKDILYTLHLNQQSRVFINVTFFTSMKAYPLVL